MEPKQKGLSKIRRSPALTNLMLRTLAGTGFVTIAVIAPKLTKLLKQFDRPAMQRAHMYRAIRQAKARLVAKGLVTIDTKDGFEKLRLSSRGEAVVEDFLVGDYRIPEKAFWDGKWRVVMFDMREQRKRAREQLRRLLQGAGFVRLQDSVWLYPYPCEEFISLLRAHLKSGVGELRFFVADALEADKPLREHFLLS